MNPEPESNIDDLEELREVLDACALRFDGYKYWSRRYRHFGHENEEDISSLVEPVVHDYLLYEEDLDNLTVFFCLQRYLGKWGGERLTPWSREHTAFRLLFLHCYRLEIPREFRLEDPFLQTWDAEFRPRREYWAAKVRNSFRTIGEGPVLWT